MCCLSHGLLCSRVSISSVLLVFVGTAVQGAWGGAHRLVDGLRGRRERSCACRDVRDVGDHELYLAGMVGALPHPLPQESHGSAALETASAMDKNVLEIARNGPNFFP